MQKGGRRTRWSKASGGGSSLSGIYFSRESRSFGEMGWWEEGGGGSTEPSWIARTFHMHESRACNPVCSSFPVAETFRKVSPSSATGGRRGGTPPWFRVLHLVFYPPAEDFIVAELEVHGSFVQPPVFRCAAPFLQDQNKYDPGASLRYVVPHVPFLSFPSFHFLSLLSPNYLFLLSLSLSLPLRTFYLYSYANPVHTACFFPPPSPLSVFRFRASCQSHRRSY